ncbi:hypothetical protein BGX34_004576, partial [Mortierella sp. NVP85]
MSAASSFVSLEDATPSAASSTYSLSDAEGPIMTRSSLPPSPPTSSPGSPKSPPSQNERSSRFNHKHEWPNGKRPRGFRTQEGKEAAEKSKNYKTGVSIPHVSAPCNTYQGVLKHATLGAIRSGGVSYGLKALVNLCLGLLKVMKG